MVTGQCLCGAVRFEVDGINSDIHGCHCSMCQHWSGGPALAVSVRQVAFNDDAPIERYQSTEWGEQFLQSLQTGD